MRMPQKEYDWYSPVRKYYANIVKQNMRKAMLDSIKKKEEKLNT